MLQCIAVYCKVMQCVAVCCSVLQVLQCVAVRCSALQCVAVCCSVLQCVAVCCSELLHTGAEAVRACIHRVGVLREVFVHVCERKSRVGVSPQYTTYFRKYPAPHRNTLQNTMFPQYTIPFRNRIICVNTHLFCGKVGLSFRNTRAFGRKIGFFCGNAGLFPGNIGLFPGNIRRFCGKIRFFCGKMWLFCSITGLFGG